MTTEEYEKSSRLWYLVPIFLGIIGGLLAYLILKKDNPKLAKRCLIVGILITIIPAIIAIPLVLYGTMLAGSDSDNTSILTQQIENSYDTSPIIQQQIENKYASLFVDPNHEVDVVWGAVTITNTGHSTVSIDSIQVRGKNIPFTNWYVDKDQSRVASNFMELQANKIDNTGQMLDSSGLTGECGGPDETILRINLDDSGSKPTLCLQQTSDSVSLEPDNSAIIYFKSFDELITSLTVDLTTTLRVGAESAYDIGSVTVRSIPIELGNDSNLDEIKNDEKIQSIHKSELETTIIFQISKDVEATEEERLRITGSITNSESTENILINVYRIDTNEMVKEIIMPPPFTDGSIHVGFVLDWWNLDGSYNVMVSHNDVSVSKTFTCCPLKESL